jgi:hypothetical protein
MKDLWPILNYEIQMYLGIRHLQGFVINAKDPVVTILHASGLVEVKALHTRILLEIFTDHPKKDNINIDQLLPPWRKDNATVAHNLVIAHTKNLQIGHSPKWYLNKFLAHPDKRRAESFNWAPVIQRMDQPLKAVFKTLPEDKLYALRVFKKYIHLTKP